MQEKSQGNWHKNSARQGEVCVELITNIKPSVCSISLEIDQRDKWYSAVIMFKQISLYGDNVG